MPSRIDEPLLLRYPRPAVCRVVLKHRARVLHRTAIGTIAGCHRDLTIAGSASICFCGTGRHLSTDLMQRGKAHPYLIQSILMQCAEARAASEIADFLRAATGKNGIPDQPIDGQQFVDSDPAFEACMVAGGATRRFVLGKRLVGSEAHRRENLPLSRRVVDFRSARAEFSNESLRDDAGKGACNEVRRHPKVHQPRN